MKSLFYTLLILGAVFLAYDYFLTPYGQRMVFPEDRPKPVSVGSAGATNEAGAEMPVHSDAAARSTAPVPATTTGSVSRTVVDGDGFQTPVFPTMEAMTKGWKSFPANAFPRQLKLTREAEFKMGAGSAKLAAGASVVALSCDNGVLTVAPTETSPARAQVAFDGTDMRQQLDEAYDKWKAWRTDLMRKQFEARRAAAARQAPGIDLSKALDGSGKPVANGSGSYDLLLASIHSGQVTDIQPESIRRWGSPVQQMIDGKATWTVDVWYDARTIFGPMEAQAQAQVRDGKVVGWIYPGSGEPVP